MIIRVIDRVLLDFSERVRLDREAVPSRKSQTERIVRLKDDKRFRRGNFGFLVKQATFPGESIMKLWFDDDI